MIKNLLSIALLFSGVFVEAKTRIKDIASFQGVRENYLVGYGLVYGLSGTGDNLRNAPFTQKGLTDFLEKLGVNVQGTNLRTKNVAAVTVTASLPPFARQGCKIDVKVSAAGDAKGIRGGYLLATSLLGADGNVYAVAQGPVLIDEFVPASDQVKTRPTVVETQGFIHDGATVEREIDFNFEGVRDVVISLHNYDFSTAQNVSDCINNNIPGNTAKAIDASTVQVIVPHYKKNDVVEFISKIEQLEVSADSKAKVVINENTGTVVIGNEVRVKPVAIAHGNLVVNIGDKGVDAVNSLLSDENQKLVNNAFDKKRGSKLEVLGSSATLSELVEGLNKLGVWPKDVISILRNMQSVGALNAVIEIR